MKKTILTLVAAVVMTSAYGQGTVTWQTGSGTVRKETSNTDTVLVNVGTGAANGLFELLWAPAGTTDLNLFNAVPGGLISCSPVAGRLTGGVRTVPTAVAGDVVALVMRGWTGGAADWAATTPLWNTGQIARGYSQIFTIDLGDPNPPAQAPGTFPGTASITLTYSVVPEPSSMALAGLGAASLLIFRRRK
jgi:hypothetical protein